MGIRISLAQIIGAILTLSALVLFGTTAAFLLFTNNQLISVDAFQDVFTVSRAHDKYLTGEHGFVFKHPLPLVPPKETHAADLSNPSDDADAETQVEESDEETFQMYLQSLGPKYPGFEEKKRSIWSSIPKFKEVAIFVLVTTILQIIVSLLYFLYREKTIPIMSLFFYSYFFIFLGHLTCMCVVLNQKPNRGNFRVHGYKRSTSDVFCTSLGLNCMILLACTIVTCVRCDLDEYSDRCVDNETTTTKRSESAANILNSATTSNDRLDK